MEPMIRKEQERDYAAAEALTREAFWNVYRPGCSEHCVLHEARKNPAFLPELTFVMEQDGVLIGHIMFCRSVITSPDGPIDICTFGPVSILPELQRKGYGSQLIRYAVQRAQEQGFAAIAITGNPAYYGRFGFVAGSSMGVHYAEATDDAPYFMVKPLQEGFCAKGEFRDPELYFLPDETVEAFDAKFPKKEKLHRAGQLV